jgi:hypothetical protein
MLDRMAPRPADSALAEVQASARSTSRATELAARYDALLDGRHRASTCEMLARAWERPELRYLGKPVSEVLRPRFVDRATYRRVGRAARLVSRGLSQTCARLLKDPALARVWGLDRAHVQLMRLEARNKAPLVLGRFDGFLAPDGSYKIIEYSNTPGAIFYGQWLAETFAGLPIMKELAKDCDLAYVPTTRRYVETYRRAHRSWGGTGTPRLAVVDRDLLDGDAYVEKRAALDLLLQRGFDVTVTRSEELEFRRGKLYASGRLVDAVYYLTEDVLEARGEDAIIRALEAGAVWLVVGPRDTARFAKAAFEILSDSAHAGIFTPDVARALREHIPWTRVVRERRTQYGDRKVDLLPFIEEHREKLVLKPSMGASGKGVILGWETDAPAWRAALAKALESSYVVQERVAIAPLTFPILRRSSVRHVSFKSGLDPYTWNGDRVGGCLVRATTGDHMGMHSTTSSIVPVFVV